MRATICAKLRDNAPGALFPAADERLLIGIEERSNGLGAQEQRLAAQIAAFTKQVEQLGPQAFASGKAAVTGEVRAALKDAASVVGAAAKEVTAPVRETLTANLAAIDNAQASLAQAREWLFWRALAYRRRGGPRRSRARRRGRLGPDRVAARRDRQRETRADRASGAASDRRRHCCRNGSEGPRTRREGRALRDYEMPERQEKQNRLCVEIDTNAPLFSADNGSRQNRVPKGF